MNRPTKTTAADKKEVVPVTEKVAERSQGQTSEEEKDDSSESDTLMVSHQAPPLISDQMATAFNSLLLIL